VVARANESSLRNANMAANGDWLKIEQKNFLADPAVVAYCQLPRHVDVDSWFKQYSLTNCSPKKAQ
jgi:hypothetical protein